MYVLISIKTQRTGPIPTPRRSEPVSRAYKRNIDKEKSYPQQIVIVAAAQFRHAQHVEGVGTADGSDSLHNAQYLFSAEGSVSSGDGNSFRLRARPKRGGGRRGDSVPAHGAGSLLPFSSGSRLFNLRPFCPLRNRSQVRSTRLYRCHRCCFGYGDHFGSL